MSHTRFRLVPKSMTLDAALNSCRKKGLRNHQKILNEDRPILSAAKCRPMILDSTNMRIFVGVPRGGVSNTMSVMPTSKL